MIGIWVVDPANVAGATPDIFPMVVGCEIDRASWSIGGRVELNFGLNNHVMSKCIIAVDNVYSLFPE